jgi:hypothetical protein
MQLKKGCSGTILTAISNDEFKKVILPEVKKDIQEEIKLKIIEMYNAKASSKRLLDIAKRTVEMAIEIDEQTATKWIEEQIGRVS